MKQFKFTPSFMAALNAGINDIAQATVRELCAAHVGKHTLNHRDRFLILRNNKQQIATFKQIE